MPSPSRSVTLPDRESATSAEAWLSLNGAAAEAERRRRVTRDIVRPRLARPEGRVPLNPYKPF